MASAVQYGGCGRVCRIPINIAVCCRWSVRLRSPVLVRCRTLPTHRVLPGYTVCQAVQRVITRYSVFSLYASSNSITISP